MNWPKNSGISPEVEVALNSKIQEFLDADSQPNGGENAQEVQGLIIDLYLIYKNATTPIETARLKQEIIAKGASWDTDDPVLAQTQKYVNRVLSGRYGEATEYLSKTLEHNEALRSEGEAIHKHQLGKSGGESKNLKNNQVKAAALNHYKQNSHLYPTKKAAAVALEKQFPPLSWQTYRDLLKKF